MKKISIGRVSIPVIPVVVAFVVWMLMEARINGARAEAERLWLSSVDMYFDSKRGYEQRRDSLENEKQLALDEILRLEGVVTATRRSLANIGRDLQEEAVVVRTSPIASLLQPLRLHFEPAAPDSSAYATDSSGVRFLSLMRLRADSSRLIAPLQQQCAALGAEADQFRTALGIAETQKSDCEVRLARADSLLVAAQNLRQCKVLLFPCPSRTTSFLVGLVGGAVGAFAITR